MSTVVSLVRTNRDCDTLESRKQSTSASARLGHRVVDCAVAHSRVYSCVVQVSRRRFVLFVSAAMSMAAMAIDLLIPAFSDMRKEFGLAEGSSRIGLVITVFFLGLAIGQLFYGTLSDRYGRRPMMLVGLGIYIVASIVAGFANSLPLLFAARIVTGIGAAGPRSLAVAMVRDVYEGVEMARLMSFVMTVFMIVPIVAPSFGALLITVLPWQSVLFFPALAGSIVAFLCWKMPETLPLDRRRSLSFADLRSAAGTVVRNRRTMAYTVVTTLTFSSMASYLGRSQPLIADLYDHEREFPIIFGVIAGVMAVTTLANSRLIPRFGLQNMLSGATTMLVVFTALLTVVVLATDGKPPLLLLCVLLACIMATKGLVMPNANTAAMQPMGAVAGTASSIIGVITSLFGAVLSGLVTRVYDPTARTLALAMFAFAIGSAGCVAYARFRTTDPSAAPAAALASA
jgi:MFS transporter, DHA1 family, multidrug resistance protein